MVTYYAMNAGGVWSAAGTWSSVAAKDVTRVSNGLVPTNAIDCVIDDYSGDLSVTATSSCKTADFNTNGAYGGTLTINAALSASGSVTFSAGILLAGGAASIKILNINSAATFTTQNKAIPFAVGLNASVVLVGNLSCTWVVIGTAAVTMTGNYDITCDYFITNYSTASTFTLPNGRTLTISTGIAYGNLGVSGQTSPYARTIKSTTAGQNRARRLICLVTLLSKLRIRSRLLSNCLLESLFKKIHSKVNLFFLYI